MSGNAVLQNPFSELLWSKKLKVQQGCSVSSYWRVTEMYKCLLVLLHLYVKLYYTGFSSMKSEKKPCWKVSNWSNIDFNWQDWSVPSWIRHKGMMLGNVTVSWILGSTYWVLKGTFCFSVHLFWTHDIHANTCSSITLEATEACLDAICSLLCQHVFSGAQDPISQ